MNVKHTLVAVALAALLTGCVEGNRRVIVEDRTAPAQSGSVVAVPPSAEVTVTPIEDAPLRIEPVEAVEAPARSQWQQRREPVPTYRANPAVVALLDNANNQIQSGQYSAAAGTLERAQRIAPRDPEVYYQMARLRLHAGEWRQAEQLALKGTQLANGTPAMQARLWVLIADIRTDAGDQVGAQRARLEARRYQ